VVVAGRLPVPGWTSARCTSTWAVQSCKYKPQRVVRPPLISQRPFYFKIRASVFFW
jgi:hypothetical protein